MRYGHINNSIMVLGASDHVPPVDPGETLGFPVYIVGFSPALVWILPMKNAVNPLTP